MRTQPWNRPVAWGVIVTFVAGSVRPALAHNESQHQLMTDYAYNLVLAMSQVPQPVGAPPNLLLSELMGALADKPEMAEFFSAAAAGVPKLRNLRTGLHEDPKPCLDPTLAAIVDTSGDSVPDWPTVLNTPLFEQPMSAAIYPVTPFYFYKNGTCEVGGGYQAPGGARFVNQPVGATARERLISTDHTGMTLGYWAAHVDHQLNDWVLRSTVLETLQTPVVSTGAAAGTAALVSLACVLACGIFPPSCAVCPYLAYEAGDTVYDAIMSIDGSQMMSEDYVGLGHFVDMKPTPAGDTLYDDKRGKFAEVAGPNGNPDLFEETLMALMDGMGIYLRHDLSDGPKNYQTFVNGTPQDDFHSDSVPRGGLHWEGEKAAHLQYTPLDNLAMFGWMTFVAKWQDPDPGARAAATRLLGWPLHAIGDASVPMHAVGTTGFGHRPYEDAAELKWGTLTFFNPFDQANAANNAAAVRQARTIVERAFQWRTIIQQWRAAHGNSTNVPIRDLVTALADQTRLKAGAQPTVYKPHASVEYLLGSKSDAIDEYQTPAIADFQRDLMMDGVAVMLALLVSAMEVSQ